MDIYISGGYFLLLLGLYSVCLFCCILSQSYHELMTKAAHGDMSSVHEYLADVLVNAGDVTAFDDVTHPIFLYGKCAAKDIGKFARICMNFTSTVHAFDTRLAHVTCCEQMTSSARI